MVELRVGLGRSGLGKGFLQNLYGSSGAEDEESGTGEKAPKGNNDMLKRLLIIAALAGGAYVIYSLQALANQAGL